MADQIPQGGLPGANSPDRTNTGPPFGGQNPATSPNAPRPLQPGQLVRPQTTPLNTSPNPVAPPGGATPAPVSPPARRPPRPKKLFSQRRLLIILLAAIIIGSSIFAFTKRSQLGSLSSGSGVDVSSRFNNIKLPLSDLVKAGFTALGGARNLSINGQLKVSDSIVLAPIVQPIAPITGQLYFDQSGSQLAYYNGSRFVSISDSNKSVVQSLGGVSGAITIGAGLNISGSTLSSTGVLSVSDASTTAKGVASFSNTNFTVANGAVNTVQDINTAATPTFGQLTLTNSLITSKITPSTTLTVGGNLNLTSGKQFQINGVQIASANLSDGANLAKLNGFNIFKNTTDSITSFQIQNAAGSLTVLNADTTNSRIGIGNAAPAFPLDVSGDVNVSTGSVYRIGGTAVCSGITCTPASGSNSYIQNGTTVQTSANFAIQSTAAGSVGGLIKGASSQTADLLDLQNSGGSIMFGVGPTGVTTVAGGLTVSAGGATVTGNSTINGTLTGLTGLTVASGGANITGSTTINGALTGLTGLTVNSGTVSLPSNSIADAALSTNVAFLNGTQTFTGKNTFKNSSNSVTAFQIQNAAASTTVLDADTTNGRVGVANAAPAFPLDVTGDINTTTGLRIGGTTVCTSSGCTAASGSGNFIQNGTTVQTNANFAIQSAAAANIGGLIRGAASQTADLFDLQTSTPATVLSVNASGSLLQKTVTNSTTALQVQNSAGTNVLSVDTTNLRVMVGSSTAPDTTFMVAGNGTGFARIGTPDGCNANYTAISLSGAMSGCSNYNILSSPTDQTLYINRPTGNSIIFRENNATQFTLLYGGAAQFQNTTNSTAALFVKNSAGTTTVLNADTTNGRVSIGAGAPAYTLDVSGDTNISSGSVYRIAGTTVCSGTTCTPASGSTNYIRNGTAIQANANFAIQSASATSVSAVIKGAVGQTADSIDIQDSSAIVTFAINNSGAVTISPDSNATNLFMVENVAGSSVLDVDTTNGRVGLGLGNSTPSEAADVVGNLKVKNATTPTRGQRMRTSGSALDFESSGATLTFSTWSGADFTGTQYNQFSLKNDGTAVAFSRSVTVQAASDSSSVFQVQNAAGTVNAFTVSTNNATAGANAANSILVVAKDSGTSRSINAAGTINASGADYAEYFTQAVPGQMQPGQVVCLTPQRLAQACNSSSPGIIIGAVSTHPGYVGNDIFDQAHPNNTILVGLLGQIRVKVSAANGAIHAGDMLTISSQSGVATKAVSPGMAIGSALEDSPGDGAIDVYIHVGYYAPPTGEAVQPTYSQVGGATNSAVNFGSINVSGATTLSKLVVTSDATISGQLEVGSLRVNQQLVVNGHIVSGGNSPAISTTSGCNATGSLEGTDTAGLVTITVTKADCPAKLGRITFSTPFSAAPKVSLTPASTDAASVQYYVDSSTTSTAGFDITVVGTPTPKTYKWYYHVIQ